MMNLHQILHKIEHLTARACLLGPVGVQAIEILLHYQTDTVFDFCSLLLSTFSFTFSHLQTQPIGDKSCFSQRNSYVQKILREVR